jgi:hypothetical protein
MAGNAENESRRFRRADLADFERERPPADDQGLVSGRPSGCPSGRPSCRRRRTAHGVRSRRNGAAEDNSSITWSSYFSGTPVRDERASTSTDGRPIGVGRNEAAREVQFRHCELIGAVAQPATSWRRTYCIIPPWRKYSDSDGVSMRTAMMNSRSTPSRSARTVTSGARYRGR